MHWDCFSNQGDIGCIVKHKAWAKMNKTIYISAAAKEAYALEATAIETCATCTFSKIVILGEEKKQASIVRARTQPKHAARYVWIIRRFEQDDYKDLRNVCGMKMFARNLITSIEHESTLTGMGGR